MNERIFEKLGRWVLAHARPLFIVAGCLTVAALVTLPAIRADTSRTNLVSADNPWQAYYQRYLDEFGALPPLVILLESADRKALRAVADELDGQLPRIKNVQRVLARLDLLSIGLLALSQADDATRARVGVDLERARPLIDAVAKGGGLVGPFGAIAGEAERRGRARRNSPPAEAGALGADSGNGRGSPTETREGLVGLSALLQVLADLVWIADDDVRAAKMRSPELRGVDELGFVTGHRGKSLVITVEPTSHADSAEYLSPLVRGVREAVGTAVKRAAALSGASIRAGVTGIPATVIDELDAIASDSIMTKAFRHLSIPSLDTTASSRPTRDGDTA